MQNYKIIFDGMDNCGKDTQIMLLKPYLYNLPTHVLHYTNCPGMCKEECLIYSKNMYSQLAMMLNGEKSDIYNLICNRSYLDEYVYGQLYRDYTRSEALAQLDVESLIDFSKNNVYLIILCNSNYNKIIDLEDNLSFNTEKEYKEKEYKLFKEVFNLSKIQNKIFIDIADIDAKQVNTKIMKFIFKNSVNV